MNMSTDTELKTLALAIHLECNPDEVEVSRWGYVAQGSDYLVLTDEEADEQWDQSLEGFAEECVLDQIPENFRHYFDMEKWKEDAKHDGRGHSLASYDGEEHEVSLPSVPAELYSDPKVKAMAQSILDDDYEGFSLHGDEDDRETACNMLADALRDSSMVSESFAKSVQNQEEWALYILANEIECEDETFYLFRQN